MPCESPESQRNVSSTANHLRLAFPGLFPGEPAPLSPVAWEAGSSHVEDYPCRSSGIVSTLRNERKRDLGLFLLPLPHALRLLGGGNQLQLSQPHNDQPPRAQTGGLPSRPTTPAQKAAETEVRGPEVALSVALDGLSLSQSRLARPHLYGASAPPTSLPPTSPGGWPRPSAAALATTSGAPPGPLPG